MTRKLWSYENTYTIFKDGEEVGWVKFIRYYDHAKQKFPREWVIESVSGNHPVTLVHFSASRAKEVLEEKGYTFEAGENKPMYLY